MKRPKKNDKYNVMSIEKAIEVIGGTEKLARKLDVCYQTVFNWKHGYSIPNAVSCIKIEKITNGAVKREDIIANYPWDELR